MDNNQDIVFRFGVVCYNDRDMCWHAPGGQRIYNKHDALSMARLIHFEIARLKNNA